MIQNKQVLDFEQPQKEEPLLRSFVQGLVFNGTTIHYDKNKNSTQSWLMNNSQVLRENHNIAVKNKKLNHVADLMKKSKWSDAEVILRECLHEQDNRVPDQDKVRNTLGKKCVYVDTDNLVDLVVLKKKFSGDNVEFNAAKNASSCLMLNRMIYVLMEQRKFEEVMHLTKRMVKHEQEHFSYILEENKQMNQYQSNQLTLVRLSVFARFERIECLKFLKGIDQLFYETIECFKNSYLPSHFAKCYRNFAYYYIEKKDYHKAICCIARSLRYEMHLSVMQEMIFVEKAIHKQIELCLNTGNCDAVKNQYFRTILSVINSIRSVVVDHIVKHNLLKLPPSVKRILPSMRHFMEDEPEEIGYRNFSFQHESNDSKNKKINEQIELFRFDDNLENWIQNSLNNCVESFRLNKPEDEYVILQVPSKLCKTFKQYYQEILNVQESIEEKNLYQIENPSSQNLQEEIYENNFVWIDGSLMTKNHTKRIINMFNQ